jgi:glycosyltransferase involved in cell wall biosynthesis
MRSLLASLEAQTVGPDQIIVVDGSDPDIKFVIEEYSNLDITYVRVIPPSLSKQRNAGMSAINAEMTLAGFLDDDLVLEPDATERMLAFWQQADAQTGGAGFSIINQPIAFANRISQLFMIDHPQPGRLLKSGFQSQIPPLRQTIETDWIYGGATIWRRSVIDQYSFDDWYIGHGYLEDVDFSYRVKQAHKLFIVGEAGVNHYSRPVNLSSEYMIGKQQVLNRSYFIKKMGHFSKLAFCWALFGQLLLNLFSSIRHFSTAGIRRVLGNIAGAYGLLAQNNQQVGGYYK